MLIAIIAILLTPKKKNLDWKQIKLFKFNQVYEK